MRILLLIALLRVSVCDESRVGHTGQNVTLPCKYDITRHGPVNICWGRGDIPSSKCNNVLISTEGSKVLKNTRDSSRYRLLGELDKGDVSLTILNLTEEDAGRYGCRSEIPGWFNDQKIHFDLKVLEDPITSPTTDTQTFSETPDTTKTTADPMTTHNLLTSCTNCTITAEARGPQRYPGFDTHLEEGSMLTVVLVCVLFMVVVLVTAVGLYVMARRWRQLKLPQQQPVQFNSTSSTLHLHHRGSAVDNIYQIDGGDYEFCP